MTKAQPQRIQLSRSKGFNLQAASLALNGLPAVKVDRSTKFRNPFISTSMAQRYPSGLWADFYPWPDNKGRGALLMYETYAPLNGALIQAARTELRGKNAACWCPDSACHATILLAIANSDGDAVEAVRNALRLEEA